MEVLEFTALVAGKQSFPKQFEGRLVCTEDLAELGTVLAVYQPNQVGRTKVVCNRPLAFSMRNWPNHFGQGCFSQ